MKKTVFLLCLFIVFVANARVGVIVNKDIYKDTLVKASVKRYILDLVNSSEAVWVDTTTFSGNSNSRETLQQLRDTLRQHYLNDYLTGAVLIGKLPYAMYEIGNPNFVPVTHIKDYWYMAYPVDYYFMDINSPLDTAWHDDSTETTKPGISGDSVYPYQSGVFDGYKGDQTCEIWISRVIADNLNHNVSDTALPMNEDSVIAAYLGRVHSRMTAVTTIPRRAIQVGDFKNWFDTSSAAVENLNIPYMHIKYPNDMAQRYVTELRKGYEWLCIYEHSGPEAHVMGMNQGPIMVPGEHGNRFWSWDNPQWPDDRSLLRMIDNDKLPPNVLFYQDYGCDNVNFDNDRCQGEMYAMLGNGLICMGSSKEYNPNSQAVYTSSLAKGVSFGESFRQYLNTPIVNGSDSTHLVQPWWNCQVLIGAATLKLAPYVTSTTPQLNIDSMTAVTADSQPYLLHDDVLRLHARISASDGASLNKSSLMLTWYGANDSIIGNDVDYILDGHDAPRYDNGRNQGTYTLTLHAEYPGYYSAVKKLEFDAWYFSKVGTLAGLDTTEANLDYHNKSGSSWDLHVRGATGNIGGNADDFVYYYRKVNMTKFYVSAKIKAMTNMTNSLAKAGVMIRSGLSRADTNRIRFSGVDKQVFIGVTYGGKLVFQYRTTDSGATTTHEYSGYSVGSTWVKLVKMPAMIYGLVSTDSINFSKIDSLPTTYFSSPVVGFAYSCSDSSVWGSAGQRWVVFGNMEMKQSKAMSIPSVYAGDTIIAGDRVRFESDTIGVKKWFKAGMDDSIIGNVTVSGNARLEDRARVKGNITLSGNLTAINGASYSGKLTEGAYVEFESLSQKTFTVGTSSISVANNKSSTISGGGKYKNVYIDSRGSLVINAGIYYFDSLYLNTDAKLKLNGHVEINVQKGILFNDRDSVIGLPAYDKVFYSNGTSVTFGEATVNGYFTAPNAKVTLRSKAVLKGRIAAKSLILENDSKVYGQ